MIQGLNFHDYVVITQWKYRIHKNVMINSYCPREPFNYEENLADDAQTKIAIENLTLQTV